MKKVDSKRSARFSVLPFELMPSSLVSKLAEEEQQQFLDDLNYLNLDEIKSF